MSSSSRQPQLRIAVNSRCGRACFYCRPSGEGLSTAAGQELTLDVVAAVCSAALELGIQEVKLTGGDPALWPQLVECVRRLKRDVGMKHVQVISRHPLVGDLAERLVEAGLDLVNISIDSLRPELHQEITGLPDLSALVEAVDRCLAVGLPCKINMVVMQGVNDDEIEDLIAFCEGRRIRTLKLLDLIRDLEVGAESYAGRFLKLRGRRPSDAYLPLGEVVDRLRHKAAEIRTVQQGGLGHPMTSIMLASGLEVLVKDYQAGAWYGSVCSGCVHYPCHDALMAIRLTADARLQFCLLREDR